jgi:preprotein translocase subunit SecE
MQKLMQYLRDVRAEMLKVTWPTWNELTSATMLVILLSIIMSVFVKLCDMGIGSLLKLVFQSW